MSSALNHDAKNIQPPSKEDGRTKRVIGALIRHNRHPDSLIEILHMVQELYGYVPMSMMAYISKELKLPASRVYGVVTFYHFFSLKPKGEHSCVVCTGTACHVRGSKQVLEIIEREFDIKPGETTRDGKLGLQTARCLGCCSLGPVAVLDNEIIAKTEPAQLVSKIREKVKA